MRPEPPSGRIVRTERRVRLGDVSPTSRLRLDAAVRYLQDVATDDSREADLTPGRQWVVRLNALRVEAFPFYEEMIQLATWCGGIGSHWAQRRTTISQGSRVLIDAATVWVQVDQTSMRPARVDARFHEVYGEAAEGATVSSRLSHHDPSPEVVATATPWPLRFTDFDALGHVNNAAAWAAVEQAMTVRRDIRPPMLVTVEHRKPIEQGAVVRLAVADVDDGADLWLVDETGTSLVSAQLRGLR
jgi:acyl-ACP thioesterase